MKNISKNLLENLRMGLNAYRDKNTVQKNNKKKNIKQISAVASLALS